MTITWFEVVSTLLGLVYVWLASRQIIWAWPVAILGSVLALFVYWDARLYLDFSLYIFFIVSGFYGWYSWVKGRTPDHSMPVIRLPGRYGAFLILIGAALTAILGWIFSIYTDASIPYWDAGTTVFSLIGTWLQARKYLVNWLLWLVVDSVYVALYSYKGLYFFSAQNLLFLGLAIYGYISWRKELQIDSK